jgi:predicted ATPase/DNA-binding CsgD family transcriptional regulator
VPASSLAATAPTPLLGRSAELEAIAQRLTTEGVRLLTLTGPAGVGKTRLALAAGAQLAPAFPDGITLVDLTAVRDPTQVLLTIAQQLGILDISSRPLLERLQEYLGERELLLILDNFEQVLPAASQLAALLAAASGITMLVTSRMPLHLRWERALRIPPLALPDLNVLPPLDELAQVPSIALFVERARAQRADFQLTQTQAPLVARLVSQLDGLPLAIELAAARMNVLPLAFIARRLQDRLHLLQWEAGDLPERPKSLEAAIGWSYDLLSQPEQRLFRHLGIFVGQVSLDAIAAVLGEGDEEQTLSGLAALAEWSLILPGRDDVDPEPSFGMLETVRAYAWEQLEAQGELETARAAHVRYFLALAERAEPELRGRQQRLWHLRLEREHDNLRVALRWLLDQCGSEVGDQEAALRLASVLGRFWRIRGYHAEGWRWLEEVLDSTPDADPAVRTKALFRAGRLLTQLGDLERSKAVLDEALALAQERQHRHDIAESLTYLGARAVLEQDWTGSVRLLEDALTRWEELGEQADDSRVSLALGYLGAAHSGLGDHERAAYLEAEALARDDARGDLHSASGTRFYLALILRELGDLPRAVQLVQEGLQVSRVFQDRFHLSLGLEATLLLIGERADPQQRARLLGAGDAMHQALGFSSDVLELTMGRGEAPIREQLLQEGWGAAYREGQVLPLEEVADLAQTMMEDFLRTLTSPTIAAKERAPENPLSEREQEVLRLVAEGLTSKAIGQRLFLSPRTVDHHLTSIFNKLGVDTRAQAVVVAARAGYV